MNLSNTKINQKMKNKSWLDMQKKYKMRKKKRVITIMVSYFYLETFGIF